MQNYHSFVFWGQDWNWLNLHTELILHPDTILKNKDKTKSLFFQHLFRFVLKRTPMVPNFWVCQNISFQLRSKMSASSKLWSLSLPELMQQCQHVWARVCYWFQTNQTTVDYSGNPGNGKIIKAPCTNSEWLEKTSLAPGINNHMAASPA